MSRSKATMETVAELAGVSTATVRRVIRGDGYVKNATREAVLSAITRTSYRPNVFARGLRTRQSSVLAFVSESELNPFFMKVAKSVQSEALRRGYTVLMLNHNGMVDVERTGVDQFVDQHVGAVIFCAAASPDTVQRVSDAGVRVVQIEREVAPLGHIALVDARPGMDEAVAHLAELGHRRIAYIGGAPIRGRSAIPIEETNEPLRVSAFRQAALKAGLSLPPDYVQLGGYADKLTDRPLDGARLMAALLSLSPRPTAVIIGSDFIAAGALQAIHRAKLRVPDDISLIGYDDSMADILTPPLATIAQPMEELGRYAVEVSIGAPAQLETLPVRRVFNTKLIVRQSTSHFSI